MKQLLKIFFPVLILSVSVLGQGQISDYPQLKRSDQGLFYPSPASDSTHAYDAINYELHLEVNPDEATFAGYNRVTGSIVEESTTQIQLHSRELDIDSVKMMDERLDFDIGDSTILVDLGQYFEPGDTFRFDIHYGGERGGEDQLGFYFFDSCAYTMSEPYDARYWIPCFDEPWDKVTIEAQVTVPDTLTAVSNGVLAGIYENPQQNSITYHWKEENPIATYLMAITIGEYTLWMDYAIDGNGDSIPLYYYVYPEDSANSVYDFANVPSMVSFFIEKYTDYPFDKYGMVQASNFRYGGMEHQSISSIHRSWVRGDRGVERGIVHELAHQWWGDYVTLADFRHIWLNEGFATFSSILWQGDFYGEERFQQELSGIMNAFFYENDSVYTYPIFDPPYVFGAACYWKGAFVLRMLQSWFGEEEFFRIMRLYAEEFAYGNASTDDFQELWERETGEDLSQFFQQWVYTAGYPRFSFDYEVNANHAGFELIITSTQHQQGIDYEMFLDFAVYHGDIEQEVRIFVTERNQQSAVDLPFHPDQIVFNPNLTALAREVAPTGIEEELIKPDRVVLFQNYPNPFNKRTIIPFAVKGPATLSIFDINGKLVRLFNLEKTNRVVWDGTNADGREVASGIYFYRMETSDYSTQKKLILIK
ncbi:MAG: T9SS type A sorting domain-containing protein [candidate division Zixibacteria bacterium]|nr:T9SS type A sorting domain-containing protein [candidate division Zixibacteria bacterium]